MHYSSKLLLLLTFLAPLDRVTVNLQVCRLCSPLQQVPFFQAAAYPDAAKSCHFSSIIVSNTCSCLCGSTADAFMCAPVIFYLRCCHLCHDSLSPLLSLLKMPVLKSSLSPVARILHSLSLDLFTVSINVKFLHFPVQALHFSNPCYR